MILTVINPGNDVTVSERDNLYTNRSIHRAVFCVIFDNQLMTYENQYFF
jgi:hypothetical protein